MGEIVQSAGGLVYFLVAGQPQFLLIKRQAMSKKIERVAPKWKIEPGEAVEHAALREISEEAGIPLNQLKLGPQIGVTQLRSDEAAGALNKDVTYFLVEFTGDPKNLSIEKGGGFTGAFIWAPIEQVLGLVYYRDIRELFRKGYQMIRGKSEKNAVKNSFLEKLE